MQGWSAIPPLVSNLITYWSHDIDKSVYIQL